MAHQAKRSIGPRRKWNSLRAANRIPEVDLERKVAEINRHRAISRRELLTQEGRLWSEMFENYKVLRASVARYPEQDVVNRLVLVEKDKADDEPEPYSEYYRQFIIFKARLTAKMFGNTKTRPPKYSELYYKQVAPSRNNKASVERLLGRRQENRPVAPPSDRCQQRHLSQDGDSAHFRFAPDNATKQFAARHLAGKSGTDKMTAPQPNISKIKEEDDTRRQASVTARPFHMPPISDRFRSKKDRQIKKGIDAGEEGHVSPLPEVSRKPSLPDIFKRRGSLRSHSSSSDET